MEFVLKRKNVTRHLHMAKESGIRMKDRVGDGEVVEQRGDEAAVVVEGFTAGSR